MYKQNLNMSRKKMCGKEYPKSQVNLNTGHLQS